MSRPTHVIGSCLLLLFAMVAPVAAQSYGTFSRGQVEIPLSGTGWTLTSGALPDGMAVRSDVPPWFLPTQGQGLIGNARTLGLFSFTVEKMGVPEFRTIRITALDVKDHWQTPPAFVGTPFSYQLSGLNNAGAVTFTLNGGTLPPGVTLDAAGLLSGTPTASGFFNVNFSLTDGTDTIYRSIQVYVYSVQITTNGTLPNATQNVAYSTLIEASGGTGGHTFTSSNVPNGLTLSTGGTLSGTPNFVGSRSFDVTATDSLGIFYLKRMSLTAVGVPPRLAQLNPYGGFISECGLGNPCATGVSVVGGGTAPFTWTASGLPPGMDIRFGDGNTLSWVAPGDLEIWGTPQVAGAFSVTLTVIDANGKTASNTFPFKVSELWQQDFLRGGSYGVPYSGYLRVLGGSSSYTAAIVSGRLPIGLTLQAATLIVDGTPLENGSFNILVEFTDSDGRTLRAYQYIYIGSLVSTVNINSFDDLGYFTEGVFLSRTLSACCVPSYAWTMTSGALPSGVSLSGGGMLTGTPAGGSSGTYTFTVRVEDGINPANFAIRQFTMRVTTLSVTGNSTLATGNVGTAYGPLSLTVTGASGAVTWTLQPFQYMPLGLTLSSGGTISGTPLARGRFNFNVRATDSLGRASVRFFSIDIYAAGENPPLNFSFGPNLGPFVVGSNSFQFFPTGGTPPVTFSLSPGATAVPGMRVQTGPPYPTFFPQPPGAPVGTLIGVVAAPGVYVTSIRATDLLKQFIDMPGTLTVSPLHVLTASTLPKAQVSVPYSFTLTPYGGAAAYSWSSNNLPGGLSISAGGGVISGTPTTAGSFNSTITLTDLATSTSVNIGHSLTVNAFAITTPGVLPSGTTNTPYSQLLSAPGCVACTWSVSSGSVSGITINSTGTFSGTPTSTFNGSITLRATGTNGTVDKVFALRINSSPLSSLSITTSSFSDFTVGSVVTAGLFVQGGTGPYTWSLDSGTLPTGIALQGPGETLGTLIPGFTYLLGRGLVAGLYSFTLRVTDGLGATTTRAFTYRISPLLAQYTNLPLTPGTLTYGVPYSQALLVVGGTGSYTWTSAPMPPGLALNSSTGVVSGTPTNTGFVSVAVTATDGAGDLLTFNVNFTIGSGTAATLSLSSGPNLGVVQTGSTQSRNVTPSGGTPPYDVTALTALPPGLSLQNASGVFTIGGVAITPGAYSFTLQGTDSVGNLGVKTYSLTVASFATFPSNTTLPDGSIGVAYSHSLLTLGGGATTWSFLSGSLPGGVSVSAAGVISGTPTSTGTFSFTLTANNGGAVNVGFSLRVSNIAITDPQALPPALFGVPYTYTFTAVGGGPGKVWSTFGGVPGGFFLSPGGVLTGTSNNTAGTLFSLAVQVTDGVVPVSRRFTLQLTHPNPPVIDIPVANSVLNDALVGQTISYTLSAQGGVAPYVWTLAGGSSLPPGFNLYPAPAGAFPPGITVLAGLPTTAGTYMFDLVVTDSLGATTRRTYTVKVATIGVVPGGVSNPAVNAPMSVQFTGFGGTGPYTFSLAPTSTTQDMLPPGVTLTAGGLLSGTPTSTGTYRSMMTAQDALGATFSRILAFTVTASGLFITNTNPAMTIGRRVNQTLSISVSGPGSFPSSVNWSLVGGSLPPGTLLVSDPDIVGPNATWLAGQPTTAGTFTYTLRATDATNPVNFAEHRFTATVNRMQVFQGTVPTPAGHIGEPYSQTLLGVGGVAPYTFTATAPPPAGLMLSAGGVISGTPTTTGNHTISFTLTDSASASQSGSISVVVTPAGVPAPLLAITTLARPGDGSVGVPFTSILNFLPARGGVSGGVSPYSWSLASGTLPPGLTVVPGGNGVADYIAGIPTTQGFYAFSLTVTDASGQSVTMPFEMGVSQVAINLGTLPPGKVGVPYSVSFGPSGGAPPYTVLANPTFDFPVGLTLSSAGVLSGTPTSAGTHTLGVCAIDSTANGACRLYRLPIDNAAGEAPAVSLSPNPIEIYYQIGSSSPVVPVAVNRTSGTQAFTLNLANAPWAGLSAASGTMMPSSVNLLVNAGSLAVGTYFGLLGAGVTTGVPIDPAPVVLTVVAPPPCTFAVNPTSATVTAAGGGGGFDVAAGTVCAWSAVPSAPWISVIRGSSWTGNGAVSYSVAANGGASERSGTITVNGAVFTITQFGAACSFAINPVGIGASASGGAATVNITASSACGATPWAALGLGATPSGGTGNGSVTVTVPVNPDAGSRVLTATIAGQTFTVNQSGAACTVALSAPSASHPSGGGSGAVTVTTPSGCSYSTVLGPSWIGVTSGGSGTGSGALVYSVEPNSTTFPRSGTLTISGKSFTVNQEALACSATMDTSSLGSPMASGGGVGSIGITMNGPNCSWTASSDAPWALVGPASGTGNGAVAVTASSNAASTTARATSLTVAGQTIALSQAGTTCSYNLLSSTGSVPAPGGAGSVGVVAPAACSWGSSSNDPSWLTISSSGSSGSADVNFTAQPNPVSTPRTGTLTIAGLTYTVNQAAAPCTYTLNPTNVAVSSDGASGSFTIATTTLACSPTAVSYASWAQVDSLSFAGLSGSVSYTADPNPSATTRIGVIQVGNQNFVITQLGAACAFSLNQYGAYFGSVGGSASFLASPSSLVCTPTAAVDLPSIVTLGTLSGPTLNIFTQEYTVSPFTGQLTPVIRRGRISFGGRIFIVKQSSW